MHAEQGHTITKLLLVVEYESSCLANLLPLPYACVEGGVSGCICTALERITGKAETGSDSEALYQSTT
jgi:hypothetical protein